MKPFSWRCPFCEQNATITEANLNSGIHTFDNGSRYGGRAILTEVIACPNPSCREISVRASIHPYGPPPGGGTFKLGGAVREWQLIPPAKMRVLPEYIPGPINEDYKEACLICSLSPKASATLARRCLQGMIRDFYGISKSRLCDEIEAIREKVDPLTWDAIDAVRNIGNIGAHMERDINVVIEVDPEEAALLIGLIENLVDDWYVARHERVQRLSRLVSVAEDKRVARSEGKEQKAESNGLEATTLEALPKSEPPHDV